MTQFIRPTPSNLLDHSGTIASGGVAQSLMAARGDRKYLLIQNNSSADLWINFSIDAVASQPSIRIVSNGSYELEGSFISPESISIYGATTGQAFTAKEG